MFDSHSSSRVRCRFLFVALTLILNMTVLRLDFLPRVFPPNSEIILVRLVGWSEFVMTVTARGVFIYVIAVNRAAEEVLNISLESRVSEKYRIDSIPQRG